jgi:two-component system osmolarity sensor histidine kinase EnvZ
VHKLRGSLAWRLALLVVITVVATQLFTWWIVTTERRDLIAKQFYGQIIDTLADMQLRLEPIAPAQRQAFLAHEYNGPGLIQLLPPDADTGVDFDNRMSPLEQNLADHLASGLNQPLNAKVHHLQSRRQLWISVQILGAPYWLVIPLGHFREIVFSSLMVSAVCASLFAILIAAIIAWRTSRPVSRLVEATYELEQGRTPAPLDENEGPKEIQDLTHGFNRMTQALAHSASERRLMLAGLSHDLRTPLTRLKLIVEMQEDSSDKPGMLSDLDEISAIVRQFIDFARSEEKPRREPVALAELASSVVARFLREDIEIQLQVDAEPEIQADPLALQRLLSNLLDNARRYGRPPIHVEVGIEGSQAMLIVTDHGDGIPFPLRQAALTPFERLHAHRGTDGGSGLGLAIVSRIVHQHEGTLKLGEGKDGGLRVSIGLPMSSA